MAEENEKLFVVDAHAHPPRKGVPGVDDRPYSAPTSRQEREDFFVRDLNEVLAEMDLHGTAIRGLLAMPSDLEIMFHFNETDKETGVTTYSCHEWIQRAVQLYPDRFFGVACVNPLEEESGPVLEDLVTHGSFKGFKIHQGHHNFSVNDRRAYKFYEKCIELDVPVAFHTGYSPLRSIDRYIPTMPVLLDELAYNLPDLKIIMCHAGGNWYQDGAFVTLRNENVMADVSGLRWLSQFFVWPQVEANVLIRRIVEVVGADRVMYGTDNDEDFDLAYMCGCGLSKKDIEKIMGENAVRCFKLKI
jgi:uncharacterized protein